MIHCSIEPRKRKYVKAHRFLSFARNLSDRDGKKLLGTTTITGSDTAKSVSK